MSYTRAGQAFTDKGGQPKARMQPDRDNRRLRHLIQTSPSNQNCRFPLAMLTRQGDGYSNHLHRVYAQRED